MLTAHPSVDYAVQALRHSADESLELPSPTGWWRSVAGLVAKGRAVRGGNPAERAGDRRHPDDVEIGAAGTLLAHRRMGHEVSILTLSRGARSGLGHPGQRSAAGRRGRSGPPTTRT